MRQYWPDKDRLRTHLAENIISRGDVISEAHKSNEYVGMDRYKVRYRGIMWSILFVDGMACLIEKLEVA